MTAIDWSFTIEETARRLRESVKKLDNAYCSKLKAIASSQPKTLPLKSNGTIQSA
jgi:hypothetical protein